MDENRELGTNNNAGIETEQKKLGQNGVNKQCLQIIFIMHL